VPVAATGLTRPRRRSRRRLCRRIGAGRPLVGRWHGRAGRPWSSPRVPPPRPAVRRPPHRALTQVLRTAAPGTPPLPGHVTIEVAGRGPGPRRPLRAFAVGADEPDCKPDPVPRRGLPHRAAAIHLGTPLPASSSGLPGSSGGPPSNAACLTLLRVGFAEPLRSPGALVVSYTTVSPLPGRLATPGRSVLCGTFPRVAPGGRYPPPCPVESGLSSAGTLLRPTRPPVRLVRVLSLAGHRSRTGPGRSRDRPRPAAPGGARPVPAGRGPRPAPPDRAGAPCRPSCSPRPPPPRTCRHPVGQHRRLDHTHARSSLAASARTPTSPSAGPAAPRAPGPGPAPRNGSHG
jgi:hypothetical protein